MDEKTSLLEQLRIDRPTEPARPGGRRRGGVRTGLIIGIVIIVLAAGGGVGYWKISQASAIPVQTATAQAVASSGTGGAPVVGSLLDASGYVVALRMASISSQLLDRVDEVPIQAGETVKRGQIIATLDQAIYRASLQQSAAQVASANASLASARVAARDATPIYDREKKELAQGLISQDAFDTEEQTYDGLQTAVSVAEANLATAKTAVTVAKRNLDYTIIRAPFDGVVTEKDAQPGQIVSYAFSGGGGIATIVDMNSLEVQVDVSENFISRVRPRMPAAITLDAYPDWHIPAEVIAIIPTADKSKATVTVRVGFKLKGWDPRILPQMGARVSFLADAPPANHSSAGSSSSGTASPAASAAVSVPSTAVKTDSDSSTGTVFVIDGETVTGHAVRLGARSGANQWILSGLDAGANVAIGDFSKLHDGARIRVTQQ
ncbi:MAG: efflux RND transporter periplasmic adaptor subunit [Steroidobacteraceae bacterium]